MLTEPVPTTILPDANHNEILDNPEQYNNRLDQFFNGDITVPEELQLLNSREVTHNNNSNLVKTLNRDLKVNGLSMRSPPSDFKTGGTAQMDEELISLEAAIGERSDDEEYLERYLQRSDTAVIYPERPESAPILTNGSVQEEEIINANTDYFIKCPQCQKGCQTFQALKEHLEAVHAEVAATSENGMSIPSTVSPTPTLAGTGGPFGCAQCNTSFSTKEQLDKHEILHSPNAQVSCKICNKTFANVYRLQRHMISHDESAILRKFKCTDCDKAFKFKHHLKEHIRIHSGEKPFECGNCGKRFSHSGSYSSHMTSKKCLVMNLKLGRTRAAPHSSALDKTIQPLRPGGLKRCNTSPINNNITTSPNHNNSYLPILPKYSEAAAALFQSSLAGNPSMPPFYITPHTLLSTAHPISPYSMPSLGHLLERLQQQQNSTSPMCTTLQEHVENDNKTQREESSEPQELNLRMQCSDSHEEPETPIASNMSESGELVMDEERYTVDNKSEHEQTELPNATANNGDLEAVKRILETVNATVTKELLHANMRKICCDSSSDSHSVASAHSPKQELTCRICKKSFENLSCLEEHECEDIRSEGLAAKLEDALTTKSDDIPNGNISGNDDPDYERLNYSNNEDIESESYTTTDHVNEDGRKVRVRSLISDEQLKVLKDNYKLNPRPKREDLEKIATSIGFPVRVVQVWFQNTRARDRREGRLIHVPYSSSPRFSVPSSPMVQTPQYCEQPLDLSVKREIVSNESSPANSPGRPISVECNDEVVNLSRKSSRSPTPYQNHHYQSSNNSSEACQSPSPLDFNSSRLAQILAQPAHKIPIPGMGLVPMDHLMQFGAADLQQSLSHLINSRISSLSPSSNHSMLNEQDEDVAANKRTKLSQFGLKSLGSPVLGQDGEAEGQFSCDQCDKAFAKQSSLARHKYEHSGQRPHKCDECPKAFKHKHHLTEHKRLHSGEKPFQCCKCLKRFSHSGSYSQHMNHRYSYCKPYRE